MGYLQEPRHRMNPASKAFITVGILAILGGIVVGTLGGAILAPDPGDPAGSDSLSLIVTGSGVCMFVAGVFLYFLGRFLVFLIDQ